VKNVTSSKRTGGGSSRGSGARVLEASIELLHQLFQSADLFSRKTLKEFGVTGPQIWALRTIENAGMLTMGELAQHMHLHVSTVTGIVHRMRSAKLVIRKRSSADARCLELRLTTQGKRILARSPEPPRSKVLRRFQRLSLGDLKKVHFALTMIAQAMGVDLASRAPTL
jgi:MarR family transcriptional regulator, organic hydroperoxide resistance regulator